MCALSPSLLRISAKFCRWISSLGGQLLWTFLSFMRVDLDFLESICLIMVLRSSLYVFYCSCWMVWRRIGWILSLKVSLGFLIVDGFWISYFASVKYLFEFDPTHFHLLEVLLLQLFLGVQWQYENSFSCRLNPFLILHYKKNNVTWHLSFVISWHF